VSVSLFVFAELVGSVEDYREVEGLLDYLLEIKELHLIYDNVFSWFYIGVGEKHEINRWIAECRSPPHPILDGQRTEIWEYKDNSLHNLLILHIRFY
jgi:hypothetical protein